MESAFRCLVPDPRRVKLRIYQTHSTHKSMSALRQGSMLLVRDVEFHSVEAQFHEAVFTHASARELGTNESEDKVLRKVASAQPPETVRQRKVDTESRKKLVPRRKRKAKA